MKWQITSVLLLSLFQIITAQNLIPNGNFEEVKNGFPVGWSIVAGTPDFHNLKKTSGEFSLSRVSKEIFHQIARAKNVMGFVITPTACESFDTKIAKLEKGKVYSLTAQILTGSSCSVGLETITISLTEQALERSSAPRSYNTLIVELKNKNGENIEGQKWIEVVGIFRATGKEQYLAIGNFNGKNKEYVQSAEELLLAGTTANSCNYLYIDNLQLVQKDLPKVSPSSKIKKIITLEDITFEFGKAQIQEAAYPVLDTIYEELKLLETDYKIIGHTDDVGTTAMNQQLSLARAEAVQKYLIRKGLSEEQLSIEGKGETVPKHDNDTEEGRSKNRRVEILILEKNP
ncbi:MAG: OmpA family protein [Bacteroidota bacterium]